MIKNKQFKLFIKDLQSSPRCRQTDVSGRAWNKQEKERFIQLFFNIIRSVWQHEYTSSMYDVLKYAQKLINEYVESVDKNKNYH